MTDEDKAMLGSQFLDAGCRTFAGKKRRELAGIADQLEPR